MRPNYKLVAATGVTVDSVENEIIGVVIAAVMVTMIELAPDV